VRLAEAVVRRVLWVAVAALSFYLLVVPAGASAASCPPLPASSDLRLVVTPQVLAAGGVAHYRIDNSDGPAIRFGASLSIQQCVAGSWVLAPFSPTIFTKQRFGQRPGRGGWFSVSIPADAAAGSYRIRKRVSALDRWRSLYGRFTLSTATP
jgi:hypothetical protein